jgi:hypothetical protein
MYWLRNSGKFGVGLKGVLHTKYAVTQYLKGLIATAKAKGKGS